MKKIALILTIFLTTALSSNAFVDNQFMTTEQYMMNTGYSAEMARMMAVTNQDPYREPTTVKNEKIWDRIYNYIAPGVNTNLDFYNHNINYKKPNWRDY